MRFEEAERGAHTHLSDALTGGAVRFGRYLLHEKLGEGGMAEVYRAEMHGIVGFSKIVALKLVRSVCLGVPEFSRCFMSEAVLGGFLSHPNIVETLDFGEHDGRPFLAMEYVPGPTLEQVLTVHRDLGVPIPPAIVLEVLIQVATGLEYAHEAANHDGSPLLLVHRDLKPSNILLSRHGVAKLADFGVARAASNFTRTQNTALLKGTVHYMSPEQAWGARDLDRRSDLFALGLVLYEMLTLTSLYQGDSPHVLLRRAQDAEVEGRLEALPASPIREGLLELLRALLSREREVRPQSAAQVVQALSGLLKQLPERIALRDWTVGICNEAFPAMTRRFPSGNPSDPNRPATGFSGGTTSGNAVAPGGEGQPFRSPATLVVPISDQSVRRTSMQTGPSGADADPLPPTGAALLSTHAPPFAAPSSAAMPLSSAAVSLSSAAVPLSSAGVPLSSTAVPLSSTAVPLSSAAVSPSSAAVPLSSAAVSLTSTAVTPAPVLASPAPADEPDDEPDEPTLRVPGAVAPDLDPSATDAAPATPAPPRVLRSRVRIVAGLAFCIVAAMAIALGSGPDARLPAASAKSAETNADPARASGSTTLRVVPPAAPPVGTSSAMPLPVAPPADAPVGRGQPVHPEATLTPARIDGPGTPTPAAASRSAAPTPAAASRSARSGILAPHATAPAVAGKRPVASPVRAVGTPPAAGPTTASAPAAVSPPEPASPASGETLSATILLNSRPPATVYLDGVEVGSSLAGHLSIPIRAGEHSIAFVSLSTKQRLEAAVRASAGGSQRCVAYFEEQRVVCR